jgi:hypothetical protein
VAHASGSRTQWHFVPVLPDSVRHMQIRTENRAASDNGAETSIVGRIASFVTTSLGFVTAVRAPKLRREAHLPYPASAPRPRAMRARSDPSATPTHLVDPHGATSHPCQADTSNRIELDARCLAIRAAFSTPESLPEPGIEIPNTEGITPMMISIFENYRTYTTVTHIDLVNLFDFYSNFLWSVGKNLPLQQEISVVIWGLNMIEEGLEELKTHPQVTKQEIIDAKAQLLWNFDMCLRCLTHSPSPEQIEARNPTIPGSKLSLQNFDFQVGAFSNCIFFNETGLIINLVWLRRSNLAGMNWSGR